MPMIGFLALLLLWNAPKRRKPVRIGDPNLIHEIRYP